jgi:hypothetical protein
MLRSRETMSEIGGSSSPMNQFMRLIVGVSLLCMHASTCVAGLSVMVSIFTQKQALTATYQVLAHHSATIYDNT